MKRGMDDRASPANVATATKSSKVATNFSPVATEHLTISDIIALLETLEQRFL